MKKIYLFKLITGEEVIASTHSIPIADYDDVNLEDPMMITYMYDGNGNYGVKMVPYMGCSDEKLFTVARKNVITYVKPSADSLKFYDAVTKEEVTERRIEVDPTVGYSSKIH